MPGEGATTQGDLAEKESTTAWCSTECGESQRIFFHRESTPEEGKFAVESQTRMGLPNFFPRWLVFF